MSGYDYDAGTSHLHKLTRQEPHLVEAFSRSLRDRVADLQQIFFDMLNCFRAVNAGLAAGAARECATQTAYVYAARLLLCRIGEDQGLNEPEMRELAPAVYELGEFDWWRESLRGELAESKREGAQRFKEQLHAADERLLDLLRAYEMSGVDRDLWRDIDQHCLSDEERQQLGGFYTPQELVDLTLDLAGYRREVERLCEKSLLDPATGSGAFVISALERLLEHLEDSSQACHRHLYAHELPEGERARGMLQIIVKNLCAIDIHPFATFLTFINVLFAVLPLYARARTHRRSFRVDPAIFLGDSLLPPAESARNVTLHPPAVILNSRAVILNSPTVILTSPAVILSEAPDRTVQGEAKAPHSSFGVHSAESFCSSTAGQRADSFPAPTCSGLLGMTPSRGSRANYDAERKFDLVVGNPPWGGLLKGRLAPIFDKHYKERLAAEYRDTYAGKLDVYGLFYDRALRWLKPGGTVALITQGSFIDKDWAAPHSEYVRGRAIHVIGLRRKLAEQASLRYLIDLNPFGKLFFGAMNIPCLGVFEKRPACEGEQAVVLLSSKKMWPRGTGNHDRRGQVVSLVRRGIALVENAGEPIEQDFFTAFRFPLAGLRGFGGARWLLAAQEFKIRTRPEWPRVAQLLEPSQGVTVGGKGCLSVFLMTEAHASELGLERALVHPIIKGRETQSWRPHWGANVILYPYAQDQYGGWHPAFARTKPFALDALDFEHPVDEFERELLRQFGLNPRSIERLFERRRDTLGLVKYPEAAEYLLKFYAQLSNRTFKKRNLREFGRAWYEFIWPRDPEVIFGRPKIISPRLTPHVRFALDEEGIGIQDSCVCLAVSDGTRQACEEFRSRLSSLLGREAQTPLVLRYLLAFLNSLYAQELLTTGHRPRPGDVFQVSDRWLDELSIPVCTTGRELHALLGAVDGCMTASTSAALEAAEFRLNRVVSSLYAAG
jgi:hypothetical protein